MRDTLEKDGIITLYISFKEDSKGWLDLHRQHSTQFVTIILAVLTVSLGASYQFIDEGWLLLAVSLGPFLSIVLSVVAIKVCDRFYKRFLEHETIADKLYFLLDDANKIDSQVNTNKNIFPNDSHLFPDRWINDSKAYTTSDRFIIDYMNKGSNKLIRTTFWLLITANLVVGIGIIIRAVGLIICPNVV